MYSIAVTDQYLITGTYENHIHVSYLLFLPYNEPYGNMALLRCGISILTSLLRHCRVSLETLDIVG